MFPVTLHMVPLFTDYKKKIPAQMLKQDVFFTFKWQADCQILQLVILCREKKRSLIITISYVWTLLWWAINLRTDRSELWPMRWGKVLGKTPFCRERESQNKEGNASWPEIGMATSRQTSHLPVAMFPYGTVWQTEFHSVKN